MSSGIWTAAAGASTQAQSVDIVANNLANSDTQGFKKDLPTFKEYLTTVEREHESADIPRGPIKDKDLYPLDGRDQSYVVVDGSYTNFRQGGLRVTQAPLDVALDGPGFLEVSTPEGVRYTRNGMLRMAADGKLVTREGYPVLSAAPGGPNAQAGAARDPASAASRFINVRDRGPHLTIAPSGEIYAGGDQIAQLSVVEFPNLNKLRKTGNQLFENKDAGNIAAPQRTAVRQGMIEGSNVNPVEEMTNLIKANRLFEHDLKAMKTIGEMMQREANDVGKL